MPEYLLSVHGNDAKYAAVPPDEVGKMHAQVGAFNTRLQDAGALVFAGGLQPDSTATVVSSNGIESTTTDGTYLQADEHIGGFWVITARDLDAALAWAAKGSAACMSEVEVRPFQEVPEGETPGE